MPALRLIARQETVGFLMYLFVIEKLPILDRIRVCFLYLLPGHLLLPDANSFGLEPFIPSSRIVGRRSCRSAEIIGGGARVSRATSGRGLLGVVWWPWE